MVSYFIKDKKKEKTSIYCSVQHKGCERICFVVPNSKIDTKDWDEGRMKTGRGRQENSHTQNKLNHLKELIEDFYSEYWNSYGKYPTKSTFQSFLKSDKSVKEYFQKNEKVKLVDFIKRIIKRRKDGMELTKGKTFSEQSIDIYDSLLLSIEGFQKKKKRDFFYVEEFNSKSLIEGYEYYLINDLKMMKNTIHNRLKTLKSFLQVAVSEEIINSNPFKKHKIVLSTEETDAVVFTKKELKELEDLDLSSNPFLEQIRDQYLLYVWSGVRKSDLKNFLSVVNPDTKSFVFRSQKTGERCEVPAFNVIKKIAQKYNYDFPAPIHDVIVLREIKNICKMIPSMRVVVEKKYTKAGKEVREQKLKHDMIVIHTARRTLATLLVDNGLPYHQVMKITGHKKITTLQKYIKSDADTNLMLEVGDRIEKV